MSSDTYVKSTLLTHRKLTVAHSEFNIEAVCEVKIWLLVESDKYPFGLKYSLYCVDKISKKILVGFDNHFPKGPHIHCGNIEMPYEFLGYDKLVEDYWDAVVKQGFIL